MSTDINPTMEIILYQKMREWSDRFWLSSQMLRYDDVEEYITHDSPPSAVYRYMITFWEEYGMVG